MDEAVGAVTKRLIIAAMAVAGLAACSSGSAETEAEETPQITEATPEPTESPTTTAAPTTTHPPTLPARCITVSGDTVAHGNTVEPDGVCAHGAWVVPAAVSAAWDAMFRDPVEQDFADVVALCDTVVSHADDPDLVHIEFLDGDDTTCPLSGERPLRRSTSRIALRAMGIVCPTIVDTVVAPLDVATPPSGTGSPTTRTTTTITTPAFAASDLAAATYVIDGDTVVIDGTRYRLIGIDTPEHGKCGAVAATANLRSMLAGGRVTVVTNGETDRYGRTLAYLELGGCDLNRAQIEAGFAIARYDSRDGYSSHSRQESYRAADGYTEPAAGCEPPAPAPATTPTAPSASASSSASSSASASTATSSKGRQLVFKW